MADEGDGRDRSAPLDDLAERVRQRRGRREVTEGELDGADGDGFGLDRYVQEEAFEDLVGDDLWSSLEEPPDPADAVEPGEVPDEHIVPKRQYCEGCEHLSAPPEVRCDHPGTTIVEFVDVDHVRVRNCPVVRERRALGEEGDGTLTPGSFGNQ